MEHFLYALGSIIYDVFTIWLAMLGVLLVYGYSMGICDRLLKYRKRIRSRLHGEHMLAAAIFTGMALAAGTVDHYILSPALGTGINFFFGI